MALRCYVVLSQVPHHSYLLKANTHAEMQMKLYTHYVVILIFYSDSKPAKDLAHLWLTYIRNTPNPGTLTNENVVTSGGRKSTSDGHLVHIHNTGFYYGHFCIESVPDPF